METNRTAMVLSTNQIGPMSHGPCQPAKNSVTIRPESVIRFTYSAIWNRPQRIPEYSVWYPATSSCSASGRSNGARLVSATPLITKTRKPTAWGTTYQSELAWLSTMLTSESEPAVMTTPSTESASDTS